MSEYYRPFQDSLAENPQDLKDVMMAIDQGKGSMDACFIDSILGIPRIPGVMGREFVQPDEAVATDTFFDTDFIYEGTKYPRIRQILHELNPTPNDVVYDVGSGYGRFCLYGALTTEATFKGVEAVSARFETAMSIKDKLHIPNVDFVNRNVVDADLSDGTIFYLFNPFYPYGARTQVTFEAILRDLAKEKQITVVTASMKNRFPLAMKKTFEKVGEINPGLNQVEIFNSTRHA